MPYGLPKEHDTDENNAKMEHCVTSVMAKNGKLSKGSAIAICKVSLGFTKRALFIGDRLLIREI